MRPINDLIAFVRPSWVLRVFLAETGVHAKPISALRPHERRVRRRLQANVTCVGWCLFGRRPAQPWHAACAEQKTLARTASHGLGGLSATAKALFTFQVSHPLAAQQASHVFDRAGLHERRVFRLAPTSRLHRPSSSCLSRRILLQSPLSAPNTLQRGPIRDAGRQWPTRAP